MKNFTFIVKETRQKEVTIIAERLDEAYDRAKAMAEATSTFEGADRTSEVSLSKWVEADPENCIKALIVEPKKYPYTRVIGSDLASLQEAVGGYIEAVYFSDDPVVIICNEEGKLNNLPLNRAIKDDKGNILDIIAGTFIIIGTTDDDFADLPEDMVRKYSEQFKSPETFVRLGDKVVAIPCEVEE